MPSGAVPIYNMEQAYRLIKEYDKANIGRPKRVPQGC